MKKADFFKELSIEELEERNEFTAAADAGCSDPTPCCCFGEPCCDNVSDSFESIE